MFSRQADYFRVSLGLFGTLFGGCRFWHSLGLLGKPEFPDAVHPVGVNLSNLDRWDVLECFSIFGIFLLIDIGISELAFHWNSSLEALSTLLHCCRARQIVLGALYILYARHGP